MVLDIPYDGYCWDEHGRGFRQRDLTVTAVYDARYLAERYVDIDKEVCWLSAKRLRVLNAFVPAGGRLLDFGCGTGRLVQIAAYDWRAYGYDLIPGDGRRATEDEMYAGQWDVVTFFDSLEHTVNPDEVVRKIGAEWVAISVPECHYPDDPDWFMRWKHRRPGEHLWHWDRKTLDKFFALLGYRPVVHTWFEDWSRPNPEQTESNILYAVYRRG